MAATPPPPFPPRYCQSLPIRIAITGFMPPIQAHYGRTYFHPGPPLAMGMISHWLPSARLGPFVAFQLLGGAVWLRLGGFRLWLQCGRCFVPSCQLLTKSRTGCTHTHTGPPSPNQMLEGFVNNRLNCCCSSPATSLIMLFSRSNPTGL